MLVRQFAFIFSILTSLVIFISCSSENKYPNAKSYEVFNVADKSYPGRKRVEWDIVSPQAKTKEEIKDTLKKAMEDMKDKVDADTYMIYMYKEKVAGRSIARGYYIYAPDGKGFGSNDFKEKLEVLENQ